MRFQGLADESCSRNGREIILLTPYERINGLITCEVPEKAAAFLREQSRRVGTLLKFTNLAVRKDFTLIAEKVEISDEEKFNFIFTSHLGSSKGVHHFNGDFAKFGDNPQAVAMDGSECAVVRLSNEAGKNLAALLKSDFGKGGKFTTRLSGMREVRDLVFEQAAPKPA